MNEMIQRLVLYLDISSLTSTKPLSGPLLPTFTPNRTRRPAPLPAFETTTTT
ncbi:hypothetical protein HanPSC8_Chr17g0763871 [Helianthus annuus]|nr:hypothetical protein HanPSC8_Chr17g0763871 [Helianthus annuus]